jgi:hypothetical protein
VVGVGMRGDDVFNVTVPLFGLPNKKYLHPTNPALIRR